MSFSRAKRFVYKSPDVDCSPADYLFSLGLKKGCSISKSSRFRKSKEVDDNSPSCSRLSHAYCSGQINGENKNCTKQTKNANSEKFNRNDASRKSIKAHRKNDNITAARYNANIQFQNDRDKNMSLCEIEEFIDDDYGSMTSSEELYDLKNIEDYELNEVYNAIKTIQQKRYATPAKYETLNFEDTVLKKLDDIDRNVNTIKEDIGYLPPTTFLKGLHYHPPRAENTNLKRYCQIHPSKKNRELLKNIIIQAIQKLIRNFEYKTKSIKKISEDHILNMIAEIYVTNNKSNKQIKELCNMTAEELVENLNNILQTSICECEQGSEMENKWKELKNECITDKIFHNTWNGSILQNLIKDYLEKTQEVGEELEENISDITLKCMDTQQMLDVQGTLLDEMKNDIENLKSNLFEN